MFDVLHNWGADLSVGNGGDLALVTGAEVTSERIQRRLLTNPGDYLWHLEYGGGLAQFIGRPAVSPKIEAVIRTQLALEPTVAPIPAPLVSARLVDSANGYVVANITYTDQTSALPVQINITTG